MKNRAILTFLAVAVMAALAAPTASAQNFGVIESDGSAEGYTLFAPVRGTGVYLIDAEGRLVNRWDDPGGYSVAVQKLSERGTLVRAAAIGGVADGGSFDWRAGGGRHGLIREQDWDGTILWDFLYHTDDVLAHHDFELMPNGNVLITAYERFTTEDCLAYPLPEELCPALGGRTDHLIEVEPDYVTGEGGTIVWEWHLWDHLLKKGMVAADHPELWDPSEGWANFNGIDYHPELDQILIGCNACDEMFIIDHDTDTEQAAGSDGDFLYRWGNPQNYDAGGPDDRRIGFLHYAHWIKNEFGINLGSDKNKGQRKKAERNHVGNILAYNNRYPSMASSSVIEIEPPLNADGTYDNLGPAEPAVLLTDITDATGTHTFASPFLCSAQKLPNGRYLIDVGAVGGFGGQASEVYEVEADGKVVWKYLPPVYSFNPGGSPSSDWTYGKCPDGFVAADAQGYPGDPDGDGPLDWATVWFFRTIRYGEDFKGFDGKDLSPGPYLADLAGTTIPACYSHVDSLLP